MQRDWCVHGRDSLALASVGCRWLGVVVLMVNWRSLQLKILSDRQAVCVGVAAWFNIVCELPSRPVVGACLSQCRVALRRVARAT